MEINGKTSEQMFRESLIKNAPSKLDILKATNMGFYGDLETIKPLEYTGEKPVPQKLKTEKKL